MIYPNVTLKIHQGRPTIELHNSEDNVREIYASPMSLETYLSEVQKAIAAEEADLMALSAEGNRYLVNYDDLDFGDEDLSLEHVLATVAQNQDSYEEIPDLQPEIEAQLRKDWQSDMLASALEGAYNLLIAKTILLADALGVEDIRLDDDRLDPHLREKMSSELTHFNTQLIVD